MLTEKQIDKIAEAVYQKHTANIVGDNNISNLNRRYYEIASKVVADMFKEYQKALQEQASSETH